jgi:hypothetical protein
MRGYKRIVRPAAVQKLLARYARLRHHPLTIRVPGVVCAFFLGGAALLYVAFISGGRPSGEPVSGIDTVISAAIDPAETGTGAAEGTGFDSSPPDGRSETAPAQQSRPAAAVQPVRISHEERNSGGAVSVRFSIDDPPAETFQSLEWDFGDGRQGDGENPVHEYTAPKTYAVRLRAKDAAGLTYSSEPLYIDVPHPHSTAENSAVTFVTLSSPEDAFEVAGVITGVAGYPSVEAAPLVTGESNQLTQVRFKTPGFYGLTVREADGSERYYSVFVSPVSTRHAGAGREGFDWYRTQFNTGTTSNCGPASASMAIAWSAGAYFPVSAVREAVGWQGEGGTSLEELLKVIKDQGIRAAISPIRKAQDIRDVIDADGIAVVLFRTDGVMTTQGDPARDFYGKYYEDTVGHYIVVKGYSHDGKYFVIYDPIPSDWSANSFRYGDERSMIGRNRYYSAGELIRSLRRADMIVAPAPQ